VPGHTTLPARLITDRSPKRCSTIPARRKNSWKDGRGDHALIAGAGIAVRSSSCAAARRLICLTTTTGGSLPLNLTYSLVKEHLVLRRQPLDHSSSTVTGSARRTRVSVPGRYEADLFEFDARPPTEVVLSFRIRVTDSSSVNLVRGDTGESER
jgi:hypothetical protein